MVATSLLASSAAGRSVDPVGERGAFDELGDDVDRAIRGAAHVVDRDDVGMVERRDGASLGEVELRIAGILEPIRRRYLDRDLPLELLVESQVNAAECSLPQQSEQAIATELLVAAGGFEQAVRFRELLLYLTAIVFLRPARAVSRESSR